MTGVGWVTGSSAHTEIDACDFRWFDHLSRVRLLTSDA